MVALNADVVGYSRLMADDFEATARVMDEYHRVVEEKVEAAGGTLVVFVGDNFMAVFDEATAAMAAAIAISTEIEDRNADLPAHRQVRFRMGIDMGEVTVHDDGQYFGEALNVAARLQALARPGGVSVSGMVYQALDQPELRFRPVGAQSLKNIPGTVHVYEFSDLPADNARGDGRTLSLEPPTVAVLPIHTETVDEAVRPAGDLIVAELLHRLASLPDLVVVDATDPTRSEPARSVVQYMLETGVHQYADNLRVYAKLAEVGTINVVFSHRWDATADDLFSLSDQISEEVARSLAVELVVGEPARIYSDLGDPAAQEKIYRGWYHLTSSTREGWERSLEYFQDVATSHPETVTGHALLAFAHWVGASENLADEPDRHLELARRHAREGIDQGDPTGLSQMVEAAILLSEGEAEQAAKQLEAAEISRPTCDVTFALEGSTRRYLGQWERSVVSLDRAMRLTQLIKPWYPTVQACSFFIGGRYEDAVTTAEAVLERQPNNLEALLVLAAAQHELGLERRARATAGMVRDAFPAVDVDDWLESRPYQDRGLVERWKNDLRAVGLIDT